MSACPHQGGKATGEPEPARGLSEVQRFDAEPVADENEASRVALVDGDCEHTQQAADEGLAPVVVCLGDDLGVRCGEEPVALCSEFGAELAVVVDAAVEGDRDTELVVDHRLVTRGRKVDDGQPPVPESE